jgi:HEAT repeat protein
VKENRASGGEGNPWTVRDGAVSIPVTLLLLGVVVGLLLLLRKRAAGKRSTARAPVRSTQRHRRSHPLASRQRELESLTVEELSERVADRRHQRGRLEALERLLARHPGHLLTHQAIEVGLDDHDPDVRLCAAAAAGPEGGPAALAIAADDAALPLTRQRAAEHLMRSAPGWGLEGQALLRSLFEVDQLYDAIRAQLLGWLALRLARPERRPLLEKALASGSPRLELVALRVLRRQPDAALVPLLVERLAVGGQGRRRPGPYSIDVVEVLRRTATPEAEAALIGLLEGRSTAVVAAAVRALRAIGTAEAVLPLLELAKRSRRTALMWSAESAVAEIQARLRGAEAGQLTLADPTEVAGELSLSDEPGGLALGDSETTGDESDEPTGVG